MSSVWSGRLGAAALRRFFFSFFWFRSLASLRTLSFKISGKISNLNLPALVQCCTVLVTDSHQARAGARPTNSLALVGYHLPNFLNPAVE